MLREVFLLGRQFNCRPNLIVNCRPKLIKNPKANSLSLLGQSPLTTIYPDAIGLKIDCLNHQESIDYYVLYY